MSRRNVTVLCNTRWMHAQATESPPPSLEKYIFHITSSKTKYCNAANFYNMLPGYGSVEIQEQGTQLERNAEQCAVQIVTR